MGRRQITNRVILALIIVLLLGVIGVIVYFKLIKPATSSPSPSPSTVPFWWRRCWGLGWGGDGLQRSAVVDELTNNFWGVVESLFGP